MSEPVKVLSMAKLLRLAKEKEERERAAGARTDEATAAADVQSIPEQIIPRETIVSQTIPIQTIPSASTFESPDLTSEDRVIEGLDTKQLERSVDNSPASVHSSQTIPSITIPQQTIVRENSLSQKPIARQVSDRKKVVDPTKGYYPIFNDISDRLIPELQLDPYEQAVLQRLYRLSRGWKKEECEVGLGTLAKQCVMSRSQVQRSITKLIEKDLIENLGSTKKGGKEGNRYRVLAGVPVEAGKATQQRIRTQGTIVRETIPEQPIATETIVSTESSRTGGDTEVSPGIVGGSTNKNTNKDLKNNTHTQVGVGSKFTIEECRRYAEHLHSTGQGINNPGGYATTIHRTGEADALIESFLHPEPVSAPPDFDVSQCPDCQGTGFYYPRGVEAGVARCKHERLAKEME